MNLILERPLAFFDLEATGIDHVNDRIVEVAVVKLLPDGTKERFCKRVNPEMEIPAHATAIHGISNKDVALAPTFEQISAELDAFLLGADLAGFNSNRFDVPMLAQEYERVGKDLNLAERKLIDVQTIFHKMEERTLSAAYRFYCDKTLENAHSADADAEATLEILEAQLVRYSDDLKPEIDFLHNYSKRNDKNLDLAGRFALNDSGVPIFNFGKHKGKPVKDVFDAEPGYYGWMMNADFPIDTKNILKKIKADIDKK